MELVFNNEFGTLNLYGKGGNDFTICEIDGLDLLEKSRNLRSYVGEDGQNEESARYSSRIISISGDIRCDGDYQDKIHNAARILSRKGVLTITSKNIKRSITVNSASMTLGKSYNFYRTFVIQMICDYPHFKDALTTQIALFKKENNLGKSSVFPIVLSERISKGDVNNSGDLRLYPVITIKKQADFDTQNTITISNFTTGKSIELNKKLIKDEEIVVNIFDRTITSSVDGNIMGTLSLYSSLSDMWCDCGENILSVTLGGTQKGIEVWVTYHNEYLQVI